MVVSFMVPPIPLKPWIRFWHRLAWLAFEKWWKKQRQTDTPTHQRPRITACCVPVSNAVGNLAGSAALMSSNTASSSSLTFCETRNHQKKFLPTLHNFIQYCLKSGAALLTGQSLPFISQANFCSSCRKKTFKYVTLTLSFLRRRARPSWVRY